MHGHSHSIPRFLSFNCVLQNWGICQYWLMGSSTWLWAWRWHFAIHGFGECCSLRTSCVAFMRCNMQCKAALRYKGSCLQCKPYQMPISLNLKAVTYSMKPPAVEKAPCAVCHFENQHVLQCDVARVIRFEKALIFICTIIGPKHLDPPSPP